MYKTCIFCTGALGVNEALEEFPVGRTVAFDAWKGRLWAVCPRCARWNLAPIEERWEAIEAADRLFTDSRLRVQSENVGLAKLRDGTRLIRIGEALPGELAAWRYGRQLQDRRKKYLLATTGTAIAAGVIFIGGPALLMAAGVSVASFAGAFNAINLAYQQKRAKKPVHRVEAHESPTGQVLELKRWHLNGARLAADEDGSPALHLPEGDAVTRPRRFGAPKIVAFHPVTLRGEVARTVLGRVMVHANASGASQKDVAQAVDLLGAARGAEEFLRSRAGMGTPLGLASLNMANRPRSLKLPKREKVPRPEALALEMALHEEAERRALEGELAVLEAAWREAEEIAGIADALPHDPLDGLRAGDGERRAGGMPRRPAS